MRDLVTFLLILAVVIVPPVLFLSGFLLWLRNRWLPKFQIRKWVFYSFSSLLWLSVLGGFLLSNFWYMNSSVESPSIESLQELSPPRMRMIPLHDDTIPEFPWPPPAASSSTIIPLRAYLEKWDYLEDYLSYPYDYPMRTKFHYHYDRYLNRREFIELIQRGHPLLLHADAMLSIALECAGQYEISYYSVPNGFALVSRLEQIEEDGTPMESPKRWDANAKSLSIFSLADYFRALFVAPPGYYRLIVFVVSPLPFSKSPEQISKETAESWLQFGANALPIDLAFQLYTREFVCTALIYEFEKHDVEMEATLRRPGRLDGRTHIIKSGIGRIFP